MNVIGVMELLAELRKQVEELLRRDCNNDRVWLFVPTTPDRTVGLLIYANTTSVIQFRVRSGPYGKGPLPKGKWNISPAEAITTEHGINLPYTDREGFAWWAKLEPAGWKCDRTSLGIHPDGNVPGTQGCLGLYEVATTRYVYEELEEGGVLWSL